MSKILLGKKCCKGLSNVKIAGWLHTKRDHGGVVFLDIRDHYGITQVVISENEKMRELVGKIPLESTVSVKGKVSRRSENMFNNELVTGEIELVCHELELLGKSNNQLPFEVANSTEAREELRLRYRFLI